jgi:hypothetical protein
VVDGKVVLDGDPPPEGTEVAVYIPGDDENDDLALTPEQIAILDRSIAQADRGETVPAEQFLDELRSRTRARLERISS